MPQSQKKIIILASYPESLVNFRLELIKDLLVHNYEVHAVAPNLNSSKFAKVLSDAGAKAHDIRLIRSGLNPWKDILTCIDIYRLIRLIEPSILLSYTIKPVVYGNLVGKFCGLNKIYSLITGLGFAFNERPDKYNVVRKLSRKLYCFSLRYSTIVIFQNPDDQELFRQKKYISSLQKSIVVNGSGVDIEYFEQSIPNKEFISFLLLARLLRTKGIYEYVAAAKHIKKMYPLVEFRIAGQFEDNPDTIDYDDLNKWVSDGSIVYLGSLEDVRPEIKRASVYVLPSYREGTPRSVLEAMAVGRPIITTSTPGCKETVVDGVNGYTVRPKDYLDLADKMIQFIIKPELVEIMGNASRCLVLEKFDVKIINSAMLKAMDIK